jgi:hypothetical protein
MLATGKPVMAVGGFSGNDLIVTPPELQVMVRTGQVRFFLLPAGAQHPPTTAWVSRQCRPVRIEVWGGVGGGAGMQLWDCRDLRVSPLETI